MEEEGGGPRLSKRFSDKGGEVDYKTTSGTAWSHSYLNQKPWHPLSYPNQRRKWIAEQQHAQRERRAEEVAREYSQEQEFFRQTALISKKEKEKVEMMQAVSFMYVRPPGYNAESAKAAEIAEEQKKLQQPESTADPSSSMPQETGQAKDEKKKPRPKDVFGRPLPTEQEFEVLKNAPRLDTGVAGRAKPFAVEVRNVKCVRCGNFGHQSGDRECPLKDVIMPSEECRLKRDDPLNAILAHADFSEPLKWELKQKPGLSPPRGGFDPGDPNQQIVAEEIFDEYGGFLGDGTVPHMLANFHSSKHRKKSKRSKDKKHHLSTNDVCYDNSTDDDKKRRSRRKDKHKKHHSSTDEDDDLENLRRKERTTKHKRNNSSTDDDEKEELRRKEKKSKHKKRHSSTDDDEEELRRREKKSKHKKHNSSTDDDEGVEEEEKLRRKEKKSKHKEHYRSTHDDNNKRTQLRTKDGTSKYKKHHLSSDDDDDDYEKRRKVRRLMSEKRHNIDTSPALSEGLELEIYNQGKREKSKDSYPFHDQEHYDQGERKQLLRSSRHANSGSSSRCLDRSPSPYDDVSKRRWRKEERDKVKSIEKGYGYDFPDNPEWARQCKKIKRRERSNSSKSSDYDDRYRSRHCHRSRRQR